MDNQTTGNNEKIRVLVVEDHPGYRHAIVEDLKRSGLIEVVAEAETGEEALLACEEFRPAVILQDIRLKGKMTGHDVMEELRKKGNPVKIVAMSAEKYALASRPSDIGADYCLVKPLDEEELIKIIVELAGQPPRYDYFKG